MTKSEEKFIIRLRQIENIMSFDINTLYSVLSAYNKLERAEITGQEEKFIRDNIEAYKVLLLPIMYNAMYVAVESGAFDEYCELEDILSSIKNRGSRDDFFIRNGKKMVSICDSIDDTIDMDESTVLTLALSVGANTIDSEEDLVITDELDIDDLEYEIDDEEYIEEEEFSIEEEQSTEVTEECMVSALKKVWGDKIDSVVDGIMVTYNRLYESGYGLVQPSGVLTNEGIVRSTTDGRITITGSKAVDVEILRAITLAMNGGYNMYAARGKEVSINDIERVGQPIVYTDLHLQFMFGHKRFCSGENSLSKYITRNNIEETGEKVIKYSSIKGWIRERVEDIFYSAYIEKGVTEEASEENLELTNKINIELSKNLKNVVIVAERKKGVNTRVRISSDEELDAHKIISVVEDKLNIGTSSGIKVRQIGEYSDGVLDINIIYNDRKYSQDTLFAYQVIDILKEQGLRPSWDNVILGKKDDGTIMTYNFKDTRNPTYALYAASGSGKGTMSLTLIAAATAGNCKILYVDGKPDMGSVLADIAWKNNVEAAVYNGVAGKGVESLENRGTSIRKDNPFMSEELIPDGIFLTKSEKQRFMLITTYLRGIELICELAADRSSKNCSTDDWLVSFVDECEQASVAEIEVMKCLERAEVDRKAAKDENGKRIDLTKDKAYEFIQEYKRWTSIITSKFNTCIKSTFRYANMTTFFVWQSTKFPEKYKGKSALADVVDSASGNIVKIIGRGAAVNYGSSVYGTPSSLKDATWYDERFSGKYGGYFAIGKNVQSNSMKVFRPFNVYSDAEHKELILENARAAGINEEDLIGVSLDRNGAVIKEVGFEGYANKLLGNYNLKIHEQLNIGYRYIEERVIALGLGESLNKFMYNSHQFIMEDTVSSDGVTKGFKLEEDEEILDFGEERETANKYNANLYAEVNNELNDSSIDVSINREDVDTKMSNAEKVADFNKAMNEVNRVKVQYGGEPEVESRFGNVSITTDERGELHVKDHSGFNVIELNKDNFVDMQDREMTRVERFKDRLVESSYGLNYHMRSRWDAVLDSIECAFRNRSMVIRVSIYTDGITVNDRIVNIRKMTDDGMGIRLEDIVNFSALINRFKHIKEIQLDAESFRWLVREYGVETKDVMRIFQKSKRLQKIEVIQYGSNQVTSITREGISNSNSEIRKMAAEAEFRQQIEQMSASYNPDFENKGLGYKNRISTSTFGFTKDSWKRAKRDLTTTGKAKKITGVFWVGASLVAGVTGIIAWSGGKMIRAFSKR